MMHRHSFRHRPPWWSQNEPFPPRGDWHHLRRKFFWRIGIVIGLMFFLTVCAVTVLFWLVVGALGIFQMPEGLGAIVRPVVFVIVGIGLAGFLFGGRSLRRIAAPMGELMDAAGHVADGDYSVRVAERGPRELRALARAFNAMTARLQATTEERRNLLADVTHELRTPLTVIQGNLEGLIDGVYPPDRAHLEPLLEETRLLSRLIDDLRTLALAERGALVLQKEQVDLGELIGETAASFHAQADQSGIKIETDGAPNVPPVYGDPARIREVLENLISNALRHTPSGGNVSVRYSVGSNQSRSVEVSVSDTGTGISPEDLPRIFDRFYKARDSRGTGLGLAIAKNLAQAHGGEISAESEAGKGTTIRFTLPVV